MWTVGNSSGTQHAQYVDARGDRAIATIQEDSPSIFSYGELSRHVTEAITRSPCVHLVRVWKTRRAVWDVRCRGRYARPRRGAFGVVRTRSVRSSPTVRRDAGRIALARVILRRHLTTVRASSVHKKFTHVYTQRVGGRRGMRERERRLCNAHRK